MEDSRPEMEPPGPGISLENATRFEEAHSMQDLEEEDDDMSSPLSSPEASQSPELQSKTVTEDLRKQLFINPMMANSPSTPSLPTLSPLYLTTPGNSPHTPFKPASAHGVPLSGQYHYPDAESDEGADPSADLKDGDYEPTSLAGHGLDPSAPGRSKGKRGAPERRTHPENPGANEYYLVTPISGYRLADLPNKAVLSGTGAFPQKVYNMLLDSAYQDVNAFHETGTRFTIIECPKFTQEVLPKHFKHSQFASFVRQLNSYGFQKLNKAARGYRRLPDDALWEMAHPDFIRGRPELLDRIKRRNLTPEEKATAKAAKEAERDEKHRQRAVRRAARARKQGITYPMTVEPQPPHILSPAEMTASAGHTEAEPVATRMEGHTASPPAAASTQDQGETEPVERPPDSRYMAIQQAMQHLATGQRINADAYDQLQYTCEFLYRELCTSKRKVDCLTEVIAQMYKVLQANNLPLGFDFPMHLFAEMDQYGHVYTTVYEQSPPLPMQQEGNLQVPIDTPVGMYRTPSGSSFGSRRASSYSSYEASSLDSPCQQVPPEFSTRPTVGPMVSGMQTSLTGLGVHLDPAHYTGAGQTLQMAPPWAGVRGAD